MKGLGNISLLIVALLTCFIVITGMSTFFSELATTYDSDLTYYQGDQVKNLSSFTKIEETVDTINETSNSVSSMTKTENSILEGITGFLFSAFGAFGIIFESFGIFSTMISDASNILGIDASISMAITAIVTVIIVFTVLSAALKWRV